MRVVPMLFATVVGLSGCHDYYEYETKIAVENQSSYPVKVYASFSDDWYESSFDAIGSVEPGESRVLREKLERQSGDPYEGYDHHVIVVADRPTTTRTFTVSFVSNPTKLGDALTLRLTTDGVASDSPVSTAAPSGEIARGDGAAPCSYELELGEMSTVRVQCPVAVTAASIGVPKVAVVAAGEDAADDELQFFELTGQDDDQSIHCYSTEKLADFLFTDDGCFPEEARTPPASGT